MKKLFTLLSMLVLAATMSFAGTINYSYQSEDTVQFLRDGYAPGPGSSVIPGGFYSEHVPDGNYHLSATKGKETTAGFDCTLNADNQRCDYSVYTQQSDMLPNQSRVKLTTVSQKPSVTDWQIVPGGPFTRTEVAPYNVYYSPTTISRDGSDAAVMTEAVPTDGTSIRYTVEGFKCSTNQYVYETYDESTDTWSALSDLKDINPNTAASRLAGLICR